MELSARGMEQQEGESGVWNAFHVRMMSGPSLHCLLASLPVVQHLPLICRHLHGFLPQLAYPTPATGKQWQWKKGERWRERAAADEAVDAKIVRG